MKQKLKRLRKKKQQIEQKINSATDSPTLPTDPVTFCREWLHYEPYTYIHPFLRDQSHFTATLASRQTGKTFNGMAKLLYIALLYPGSTILVTAPKLNQVKRIAFKHLHDHLNRVKRHKPDLYNRIINDKGMMRTMIRLKNGSTILAEPPVPETIRGHTAKAVYLMEMNFIREDKELYTAVLFTLNTTNGYLLAESTPWTTDSVFYQIYHTDQYKQFNKHTIPYTQALPPNGPLTPEIIEMIKNQLRDDPARWRREMQCQWTEDTDRWLPMNLITHCTDHNIEYHDPYTRQRGAFYLGVDLGKKRDHTVIAAIERMNNHQYLRLCHRFPLDTPYTTVIGFIHRLQTNWSTIKTIALDQTGVGEYIHEDMKNTGIRNLTGVTFTQQTKEAMATSLREQMRQATCPTCGWTGTINPTEPKRHCPKGCHTPHHPQPLTPTLHIPYDPETLNQLNTPTYTLTKTGKLQFNHPENTHDDIFWAIALAAHQTTQHQTNRPLFR